MVEEIVETIKDKFDEYGKPIITELQTLAKKYGAWIIVGLLVIYLWKRLQK